MEYIQRIYRHPRWQDALETIRQAEADRVFCRHTPEHFLDVARIAYLANLEQQLGLSKRSIYAAALLHDMGRAAQYRDGTPHELAGAALAQELLDDCGFPPEERDEIVGAVAAHRSPEAAPLNTLSGLIAWADKRSRLCLFCSAEAECNWPPEKKNLKITL